MRERASGILLHPTSLPGRFGIGDLGSAAENFLDWLDAAGQSWWQILPLGPPEACDSPYNCLSAFAGNPLLISPELLVADALLESSELEDAPHGPSGKVDFAAVTAWKEPLLRRAWERFESDSVHALREEFESSLEAGWLADWTLFEALRRHGQGRGWWDWDPGVGTPGPGGPRRSPTAPGRRRSPTTASCRPCSSASGGACAARRRSAGIRILGDLPIYVAMNSAEVWARPNLFDLDEAGTPEVGGRCGRPTTSARPASCGATRSTAGTRWPRTATPGGSTGSPTTCASPTWCGSTTSVPSASFWRVPAGDDTAVGGEWVDGPGRALFEALENALGELPILAEDLGDITPDVEELLARPRPCPACACVQFGFDEPPGLHAAHNLVPHSVVYSGTHDNDTVVGWYRGLDPATRQRVDDYCGISPGDGDVHWHLVRLALTSVADLAIVPAQDVLGLGGAARMNTPAPLGG